jgi:beta-N-acetylhexosaminidase
MRANRKEMSMRRCVLLVLLLAGLLPAAGAKEATVQTDPASALEDRQESLDPVADSIAAMSLRHRIAQLMLVTMEGKHGATTTDLGFLRSYTPAGAVVRQIRQPSVARSFVEQVRGVESISGVPLWLACNVWELSAITGNAEHGWFQVPTLLTIGATNDVTQAEALGDIMGTMLHGMGYNFHLGPALSLAPTLSDARGSVHCFGSDPVFAGTAGAALYHRLGEAHVLAMPMGFPGGELERTPGTGAVLLTQIDQLHELDLLPYKRVIEEGAEILHVGTAIVPSIDPANRSACLSPLVMSDLLRLGLGFEGIVVAGPIDHDDIRAQLDPAEAALQAFVAGADVLYWQGGLQSVMRAVDHLVGAVQDGKLTEARINDALKRVLTLKFKRLEAAKTAPDLPRARTLDDSKKMRTAALDIERRAITLLKNDRQVTPLTKGYSMPIGVTGVVGVEEFRKAMERHIKPIAMQEIKTARHVGDIQDFEIKRLTQHIEGIRTVICIFTEEQRLGGMVELVRALKAKKMNVVVIYLGYPRNAPRLLDADVVLLGYCDYATQEVTLQAAADVLAGVGPAEVLKIDDTLQLKVGQSRRYRALDTVRTPLGRLPVTLNETLRYGYRLNHSPQFAIDSARWTIPNARTGRDQELEYAFTAPGTYPISLTISDKLGNESTGEFKVEVTE